MTVNNADQDNWNKTADQSAPLDTDWGKDWEAAFQAEDSMLPSENAGGNVEEFFLDDADKAGAAEQTALTSTAAAKTIGAPGTVATGTVVAAPATSSIGRKISTPWSGLTRRLAALTLKQKLLAALLTAGACLLLATGGFLLLLPTSHKPPVVKHDMPAPPPPIPDVVVGPAEEPGSLSNADHPTDQHPVETPSTTEPPPPAPPEPHKIRQKWAFPNFTIPTTIASPDKGISFVRLKVTLIASLPPDVPLPLDKKIIVRELIYQYIKKQPPEELQRFVRIRGDLSHGLLTWLAEQWPDNPVKSVQIDSYSLS